MQAAHATEVISRIADSYELTAEDQVGLITLNLSGSWSSAALRPGFRIAVRDSRRDELVDPHHVLLKV